MTTEPTHAERARTLAAAALHGSLSTLAAGHPYGSLVAVAMLADAPLLLLSGLAEHTRNLQQDPRCSLLLTASGPDAAPLAAGRVSLLGRAVRLSAEDAAEARAAFLAIHPEASTYVDFRDFGFWRIDVEAVRYVGGFGRMSWVDADAWASAVPDPIAPVAAGIVAHMNADHRDAMRLLCVVYGGTGPVQDVQMTGVDRYGFGMLAQRDGDGDAGAAVAVRLSFTAPVSSAGAVRTALVSMVQAARQG